MRVDFWRQRRVFMTGHTGFKGSWLSLWLSDLGADVTGYALQPHTDPSLFGVARLHECVRSHIGDIRDFARLSRTLRESRPEIVIHMAAQPIVRQGYSDPSGTYSTNVMGAVNMLEAVRSADTVRAVVIVTSDKCYANQGWAWGYREIDRLGGHDPYSASKACVELIVSSYRESFYRMNDIVLASARAGNVIGGGDWATDRLVPDLMRSFMAGDIARLRAPDAVRPWQHVLEPLQGYLLLAQRCLEDGARFGEAWNFSPDGDPKPVRWIADRLARYWGGNASWELDRNPHPHEDAYLYLDNSKAKAKLGYAPLWDVDTALEKIARWFRAYKEGGDMRRVTLAQIHEFAGARPESPSLNG